MAYTKYSLTPADNNAAPPNGAPEGMLPSAVNDTMRDMMSQIRDVGDGIRGGTYTMTAPVITGGSISGSTMSSNVITGGSINNTPIGASTANTGAFTTLGASGVATFSAGSVSAPAITTTGDSNTGIYFPAADTIAFTEGGVESMRITSSGSVAIGTTTALSTLTVNGVISVPAATTESRGIEIGLGRTGNGFSYVDFIGDATYTDFALRIARENSGANAVSQIVHRGTGNLDISTLEAAAIRFVTNNTQTMVLDSTGCLSIGTAGTTYPLFVAKQAAPGASSVVGVGIGCTSTTATIELYGGTSNGASLIDFGVANGSTDYLGRIFYTNSTNSMAFSTNTTERVVINTAVMALTGLQGIQFQATQSASSNANTLDDYEEGTWTPSVTAQSGAFSSITIQHAKYTKIGNFVTAAFNILVGGVGTAGGALVATLPFTSDSNSSTIGAGRENNLTGLMLQGIVATSSGSCVVFNYLNNAPYGGNGAGVVCTVSYFTAT
jgi:hypothetical protein